MKSPRLPISAGVIAAMLASLSEGFPQANSPPPRTKAPFTDRSRLPEALRNVRLDRLSSGALMLLDRDGDLVEAPAAVSSPAGANAAEASAAVALHPRVGANIRLGNDPAALPPGRRAQAEPHIVRAPTNANLLLATFQEGRFASGGGAVDCGFSVSHNAGLSWSRALIPGLTAASGGPYVRATDPVAGIDSRGYLFLCTLAARDNTFTEAAVVVSRSTDGGATFGGPSIAYDSPDGAVFPDKNWMAINTFPGTATFGRIAVTFTAFTSSSVEGAPIMVTYSDNGGATWTPAIFIHSPGSNAQGSQPLFLPDGRLAIVYWNFGSPGDQLEVVVSNPPGSGFSAPRRIASAVEYHPPQFRSGSFLPSAAIARNNGKIFVVYQAQLSGVPRVLFTMSSNAGVSWTTPVPITDNTGDTAVFNPAISVSADGRNLSVAFYDNRLNPGQNTLVNMFGALSFNGGRFWQPNIRLSSETTDGSLAPLTSSGYMLGDYLGIAETSSPTVPAVPVWVDTRTGNPDPFVTRVSLAQATPLFDFDGDGATDVSVFRDGVWYVHRSSTNSNYAVNFGSGSDTIVPADYDGDGKTDIAVFRSGRWLISQSSNAQLRNVVFGVAGDIPRPGDFDGDGKADLALFRPGNSIWYYNRSSDGRAVSFPYGAKGDIPLLADFDADGRADFTLFRPANSMWYFRRTYEGSEASVRFGVVSDIPVPGDYDGDARTDIAVFRSSNAVWYNLNSTNGSLSSAQWRISGDDPAPGDYDLDGKTDLAVYRGSVWDIRRSTNRSLFTINFGVQSDTHVPAAYLPQ